MNKIFKGLIRFLIEVIVMTVLIVGINIFTNGMYLWGLPRINDIQSVNITYPSVTDDVKEISSSEDIELALKLTGFLKYDQAHSDKFLHSLPAAMRDRRP